jgi:hypothetical protein
MSVTENELEERAVAPRVTLKDVEEFVLFTHYFTAADGIRGNSCVHGKFEGNHEPLERLTFCVLILRNGFTLTGQSACASKENYQQDIGQRLARQDAINKLWAYLGFELCTKLSARLL